METFTEIKQFVGNPNFQDQRQKSLACLSDSMIDEPIIEVINGFNQFTYCFTLQSCYGHFVYRGQNDSHNLEPLPNKDSIDSVEYRIAYICLCIENSDSGKGLLGALNEITAFDPENIQLCCAEWFWKRQVNSFALQVQPERFKHKDKAMLDYNEALQIEKIRNEFFGRLQELLQIQQRRNESGVTKRFA